MISTTKSTVSLFTPHTLEAMVHPQVAINNQVLPLERQPKILGIVFDTMFTFAEHGRQIAARAARRTSILRALTSTNWGQQKETLLITYKAIGRSILNYGAPVWAAGLAASGFSRLQAVQNSALRVATGCVRMSSVDHLHQECSILPVKTHSDMIASQYLANCQQPGHPCHDVVGRPEGRRRMKPTLNVRYALNVNSAANGVPLPVEPKKIVAEIHRQFVSTSIARSGENIVLGGRPPPISSDELDLSRRSRRLLAQLRSGHCPKLRHYWRHIDPTVIDICPRCGGTPHDVKHIFNCPAHPTAMEPIDLWQRPAEAINHAEFIFQ